MNCSVPAVEQTLWCAPDDSCSSSSSSRMCISREGTDIYFCAPITHASAFRLMELLRAAEKQSLAAAKAAAKFLEEAKSKHPEVVFSVEPVPIVLHLTTLGGLVHAAFAVVDTIEGLKVPVHTVIAGYVASAGTLISLSATKRFMQHHATALLHEVRSSHWGKLSDLQDSLDNTKQTMDSIIDFYAQKTKIPKEQLPELLRRDRDWTPAVCLEKGIVDEIK